jgi:hypothetical protein
MRALCNRHAFDPATCRIAADSALSNAALIPLSLLPGSSTTNSYSGTKLLATAQRLLAAGCTLPAWALALCENRLFQMPAQCVALMQKPHEPRIP